MKIVNISFPLRIYTISLAFLLILASLSCGKNKGGNTGGGGTVITPPTPVWDVNALRGAWITTAASTALDSRTNIQQCVQACKAANINNIFVVVYNNGRTIYPSTVMQSLIGIPIIERYSGRDPQCYRYDIAAYTATLNQQKGYYRNPNIPFYPGVLVKSGATIQSDGFMTQMIQQNRLNGFKGECFFFYEGVKDKSSWFQGQYPFIR
jgi:hypothetical protein